jgi:hypothetical protein
LSVIILSLSPKYDNTEFNIEKKNNNKILIIIELFVYNVNGVILFSNVFFVFLDLHSNPTNNTIPIYNIKYLYIYK